MRPRAASRGPLCALFFFFNPYKYNCGKTNKPVKEDDVAHWAHAGPPKALLTLSSRCPSLKASRYKPVFWRLGPNPLPAPPAPGSLGISTPMAVGGRELAISRPSGPLGKSPHPRPSAHPPGQQMQGQRKRGPAHPVAAPAGESGSWEGPQLPFLPEEAIVLTAGPPGFGGPTEERPVKRTPCQTHRRECALAL